MTTVIHLVPVVHRSEIDSLASRLGLSIQTHTVVGGRDFLALFDKSGARVAFDLGDGRRAATEIYDAEMGRLLGILRDMHPKPVAVAVPKPTIDLTDL